ncbi:MAG: PAS domain-containing protein, partial [Candidatus Hodarchaeota archaeon]
MMNEPNNNIHSEWLYFTLLENASDVITLLNENLEQEYVNENQVKLLGFTKPELMQRPFIDFVHPDHISTFKKMLYEDPAKKEFSGEFKIKRKNEEFVWLDIKGKVLLDYEKKRNYLLFSRDISDKKRIEVNLKNSEKAFKSLINNLSETVIRINNDGRISYASPQVVDLIGFYPSEMQECNFFDIVFIKDQERLRRHINECFDDNQKLISEFKLRNNDGSYRNVSAMGIIIDDLMEDGDKSLKMTLLLKDITKELEKEYLKQEIYTKTSALNIELERKIRERTKELENTLNALKHSEKRLKSILDNTPAIIYLK